MLGLEATVRRRIRGVTRSAHRLHYSPVRTESPSKETLHFFSDRALQTPLEGKCRPLEAILVPLMGIQRRCRSPPPHGQHILTAGLRACPSRPLGLGAKAL